MKPTLLTWLCCLFTLSVLAQPATVYPFWKDDSLLRRQYITDATTDYQQLIQALPRENRDELKDIYKARFNEIQDLLGNARTTTALPIDTYLKKILSQVVVANPDLQSLHLRVLLSRDWWPNAYSMGDGTLIINAGLLVYLQNEAELAFVLAHEIAHYYLDHGNKAILKYVATVNSDSVKKELKRLQKEDYRVNQQFESLLKTITLGSRRHSRENEAEADRYAFRFLRTSTFDKTGILSCLQMLDHVDDTALFQPAGVESVFDFPNYPFRKKWVQQQSVLFGAMQNDDASPLSARERDSLKTHPNCSQRIAALRDSVAQLPGGSLFSVDEQFFRQLKQDCFVELTEDLFRRKDIGRNLYYSILLLQQEVYAPFAMYSIARDLNKLYELQKEHRLGTWYEAESRQLPKDYNLVLRMISKIKLEEIAALAYYFCQAHRVEMAAYPAFTAELDESLQREH